MLSHAVLKNLQPKDKLYRKTDSNGLLIEVKPSGVKVWRYRYRYPAGGKETMISLGEYPRVSLKEARQLRDEARRLLDSGLNPKDHLFKQAEDEAGEVIENKPLFSAVYEEWLALHDAEWSPGYALDLDQRCRGHLLPYIGHLPIDEITASVMLDTFKRIEARGTLNMLKKVRGYAGRVFRFGVGMGYCDRDPTRDLPNDVFRRETPKNFAHTIDPKRLGEILRAIDSYGGYYSTKRALQIMPYLFLRPASELLQLQWGFFDWDQDLIILPAELMKKRREHVVPMARQVKAFFAEMFETRRLDMDWVFPSSFANGRPISETALRKGLVSVGVDRSEQVPHGFRHTASTLLNEAGWDYDAIERQLAHLDTNRVRGTYNKAQYMDKRRKMMQWWADYLDDLKSKDSL